MNNNPEKKILQNFASVCCVLYFIGLHNVSAILLSGLGVTVSVVCSVVQSLGIKPVVEDVIRSATSPDSHGK